MNYPKPHPGKIHCVSCHDLNVAGCFECRQCKICGCICKECWNCTPTLILDGYKQFKRPPTRHHHKYFCSMCDKCTRQNFEGVSQFKCQCKRRPIRTKYNISTNGFKLNPLQRSLGLELEFSTIGVSKELKVSPPVSWSWTMDGSISIGGQELVVNPLIGDNFISGAAALGKELERLGYLVNDSCGFHVHVGTDTLTKPPIRWGPFELRRLIIMYKRFEDIFYKLVKPNRDEFHREPGESKCYCKRLPMDAGWYNTLLNFTDGPAIRKYLIEWMYFGKLKRYKDKNGKTYKYKFPCKEQDGPYCAWPFALDGKVKNYGYRNIPEIYGKKYQECRYYALNLHTFFQRGTVEYRHHEGTTDSTKLVYWPLWCGWFTELVSIFTDQEAFAISNLDELLDGQWKKPYRVVAIPQDVKDWVRQTLKERKEGRND